MSTSPICSIWLVSIWHVESSNLVQSDSFLYDMSTSPMPLSLTHIYMTCGRDQCHSNYLAHSYLECVACFVYYHTQWVWDWVRFVFFIIIINFSFVFVSFLSYFLFMCYLQRKVCVGSFFLFMFRMCCMFCLSFICLWVNACSFVACHCRYLYFVYFITQKRFCFWLDFICACV